MLKNFTMVKLSQAIRHLMLLLIYSQFGHKNSSTKAELSCAHSTITFHQRQRQHRLNLQIAIPRALLIQEFLLIMKQFILNKNNNRNFLQIVLFSSVDIIIIISRREWERAQTNGTRLHPPTQFYCWKFSLKIYIMRASINIYDPAALLLLILILGILYKKDIFVIIYAILRKRENGPLNFVSIYMEILRDIQWRVLTTSFLRVEASQQGVKCM